MVRSGRGLDNEEEKHSQDTMQEDLQHDEVKRTKLALYI